MQSINRNYKMRIANSSPPNKYGAYPFSIDSINSIRDIDIYVDEYSNKVLTKACKDVLLRSMNAHNPYRYGETGRLVSILDEDLYGNKLQHIDEIYDGNYDSVSTDKKYSTIVSNRGIADLVFVHNHPNNASFSGWDLEHLYKDRFLYGIIAVGNRHNVFIVTKNGSTKNLYKYIQDYAKAYAKSPAEMRKYKDIAAHFILEHPDEFNIEYTKMNRRTL